MGALISFNTLKRNTWFILMPVVCFGALACNTLILVFSGLTTLRTPKTNFKNNVTFLFGKLSFQFGIIFSLVFLAILISSLASIISGRNIIKYLFKIKIFALKFFYYILLIAFIDILVYLFIYRLITPYSTVYSLTEFFTEPIYLLYLILYYKIYKKAHFYLKQIAISYSFFIIGIISMVIGLSKYYCETILEIHHFFGFNLGFNKYYCKEETSNYFYNNNLSIIISIFIIPFLFFSKMFLAKRYMEITNIHPFILMFKNYCIEFIISTIFLLIIPKKESYKDIFPFNLTYVGIYSAASDIQELLFLFFLKNTSLFYIFILLVFRKLDFHLLAGFNAFSHYFLFLIVPILTNIFGLITFSFHGDSELEIIINGPLIIQNINVPFEDLENQTITKMENEDNAPLNNIINNEFYADDLNKEGAPPLIVNEIENNNNKGDYQNLKIENLNLISENKSLNLKIKSLQIKNQTLEEINEKLTNKIAMLCEKYNINQEEDLNYMKP